MGSENPSGAGNQQGSRSSVLSAGGLTPQRLHAELLEADARETRAYLLGAQRDGTYSRIHGTLRISQSDIRWLHVLQDLFLKLGSRSWVYREGKRNVWVVETTCRLAEATIPTRREMAAFAPEVFRRGRRHPKKGRGSLLHPACAEGSRGSRESSRVPSRSRHPMRTDPQPERSDGSELLEVLRPQQVA